MGESLKRELERLNERYREIDSPESGRMLLLERGSRMLELRTRGSEESAFWTDPSSLTAGTWNVGGDRTWLSPELDYHMNAQGEYFVPAELDPGSYRLEDGAGLDHYECSQELAIRNRRAGSDINVSIRKRYSPLRSPLKAIPEFSNSRLLEAGYAGYECETILKAWPASGERGGSGRWINSWSIMQVPLGGTVIVPTVGKPRPEWMYGPNEETGMIAYSGHLRIPFTGKGRFKLSLDALQSAGRFGYVRKINEDQSSLLVRQFQVRLSGHYPDYPLYREDDEGSCLQFFCDGGQLGGFGELEYHAPAIRWEEKEDLLRASADVSQVYYFVGTPGAIEEAAERLLGVAVSE